MKSITVATIATVILSLQSIDEAAAKETGDATTFNQVTARSEHLGTKTDHEAINERNLLTKRVAAGRSMYLTQSQAPVMDATQPPAPISPPILAGTIPEDPPMRDDRSRKQSKDRKQGKGLFDRLFRRS